MIFVEIIILLFLALSLFSRSMDNDLPGTSLSKILEIGGFACLVSVAVLVVLYAEQQESVEELRIKINPNTELRLLVDEDGEAVIPSIYCRYTGNQ